MWRNLVLIGLLASSNAYATDADAKNETRSDSQRKNAQALEVERLQVISGRGLQDAYRALAATGKVPATGEGRATKFNPEQVEAASRATAINLAAFGIKASDVRAYGERKVDLFDVGYRLFQGRTSPVEQMLLMDTIVIATAGEVEEGRTRVDGFLSATPFTVLRSIKGSRAPGDVVYMPRKSGPKPGGTYLRVSSDVDVSPGKQYLLAASRNWYEQIVAETKKQPETSFTAAAYLVYEVSDDGSLLTGPRPTLFGEAPKDVQSVVRDLDRLSSSNGKQGGGREN